jgi:hypothetical protein
MTYSKQTRKAALTPSKIRKTMSLLGQDPAINKLNSMIKVIEERNPGDTKSLKKWQEKKENRIFEILAAVKP